MNLMTQTHTISVHSPLTILLITQKNKKMVAITSYSNVIRLNVKRMVTKDSPNPYSLFGVIPPLKPIQAVSVTGTTTVPTSTSAQVIAF